MSQIPIIVNQPGAGNSVTECAIVAIIEKESLAIFFMNEIEVVFFLMISKRKKTVFIFTILLLSVEKHGSIILLSAKEDQ